MDGLITPHYLYQQLGIDERDRRTAYQALFKSALEENVTNAIREATNKAWVLGNDHFKSRIENMLDRQAVPRTRGGDRKSRLYRERQKINRV